MKRNIDPSRDSRLSTVGDDEPECTREGGSELFVGQRMREMKAKMRKCRNPADK